MRYTRDWYKTTDYTHDCTLSRWAGTANPAVIELAAKLDSLSPDDLKLLLTEFACCAEQAYRRGFQQALHIRPSNSEAYCFRYSIPLEFAVPYEIAVGKSGAELDRRVRRIPTDETMATSYGRLECESGTASALIGHLFDRATGSGPDRQICWGPGDWH